MNLAELKEAYKARKLALDSAKKEEEKYKAPQKEIYFSWLSICCLNNFGGCD